MIDHLPSKWLHFITIYQYMQMYKISFFPCQLSIFPFSSYTTRLVEYGQGWLNWAFTSIIISANPSSPGLNMWLLVIGVKVWYLLCDICLIYQFLNLRPIFHNSLKPHITTKKHVDSDENFPLLIHTKSIAKQFSDGICHDS